MAAETHIAEKKLNAMPRVSTFVQWGRQQASISKRAAKDTTTAIYSRKFYHLLQGIKAGQQIRRRYAPRETKGSSLLQSSWTVFIVSSWIIHHYANHTCHLVPTAQHSGVPTAGRTPAPPQRGEVLV